MKNTLMMQYEFNGEAFEIWNTDQADLELALKEMDNQPEESGIVFFKNDSKNFMTVNGGFQE